MDDRLYEAGLVLAGLAFWAAGYGLMLLLTRPRTPRAEPANPDLGDEPPAIVSLLANGWDVTEDAAEATLLDLAARGYFELRQPGNDPRATTIHPLPPPPDDRLTTYEARVVNRVGALAVGGVVPLTALTFRDVKQAKSWAKSLREEVVSDARRRGLSRRRFTSGIVAILVAAAALAMVPAAIGIEHFAARDDSRGPDDSPWGTAVSVCIFLFIVLTALSGRSVGERDTAAGRQVAGRWLGVRDWLRAHDAFADLPPAAVTLWDRYLSYGAALGTTRVSSAVIDLGLGNRKRVWSSFGDTWHQVRVRYPRLGRRFGRTPADLGLRAVLSLGLGYLLVRYWATLITELSTIDELPVAPYAGRATAAGVLLGWALLVLGAYLVIGVIVDLSTPVTITGQVLWVQVCKQNSGGEDRPPVPWLYHYAVDDGRSDKTVAWALPAGIAGSGGPGATVTFTARRWTRRVLRATVVSQPRDFAPVRATVDVPSTREAPAPQSTVQVLSAEEATATLGLPLRISDTMFPGPFATTVFVTGPKGKPVLMMQRASGTVARLAWRGHQKGAALPDLADAFTRGNQGAALRGDTVLVLTLVGEGKGHAHALPALLAQAAARLPEPAPRP